SLKGKGPRVRSRGYTMGKKLRIGVVFGGRSGEHEVSIASAASVLEALDTAKYDVVPIGITQEGRWLAGADPRRMIAGVPMEEAGDVDVGVTAVVVTGDPTRNGLVPVEANAGGESTTADRLDILLPVLHGTYGGDGTLQGRLEMANLRYAGCGVLGSALGMDKEKAKLVFKAAGLPVVDWAIARRHEMERDLEAVCDRIERQFLYPFFVKPANLGSSVGVSKA